MARSGPWWMGKKTGYTESQFMMNLMKQPNKRAEFERGLFLLREQMMSGKLLFPRGMKKSELGLLEVRRLPNGRIDFLSVNEFARLQANMMAHMLSHPENDNGEGAAESEQAGRAHSKGTAKKRARSKRNTKKHRRKKKTN